MSLGMNLKIRQHNINPCTAQFWLNDMDISQGLQGVTVHWETGDVTRATLNIAVSSLDIDAQTLSVLEAHVKAQDG